MIPKYQRKFSWTIENAHSLVRDIAEVATQPRPGNHWTGAVIYREIELTNQKCPLGQADINHICREIIDGQQRLTTILLWIQALIDHQTLKDPGSPLAYALTPFYLQTPNNEEFELIRSGADVSPKVDLISKVYMYFRYLLWHGEGALSQPDALLSPSRRKRMEGVIEHWQRWVDTTSDRDDWIPKSGQPDCKRLLELTISNLSFLGIKIADEEPERVFAALNGNMNRPGYSGGSPSWRRGCTHGKRSERKEVSV